MGSNVIYVCAVQHMEGRHSEPLLSLFSHLATNQLLFSLNLNKMNVLFRFANHLFESLSHQILGYNRCKSSVVFSSLILSTNLLFYVQKSDLFFSLIMKRIRIVSKMSRNH